MNFFKTLSRGEVRTARAVFETIFPSKQSERMPTGISGGAIEEYLEDLTESWETIPVLVLRAGLFLVAFSSVFLAPSLKPFHFLPEPVRLKILTKLYAHNNYFVRQLIVMLKAVGGLLYGAMIRPTLAPSIAPAKSEALIALRVSKTSTVSLMAPSAEAAPVVSPLATPSANPVETTV